MTVPLETEIATERLLLRRLDEADAVAIQALASDERVSRFTALIPHPYPDGAAARFIAAARADEARDKARHFALCLTGEPDALLGIVSARNVDEDTVALGYWLGVPYWGRGYMSEAVAAVAAFARNWRPGATIGAHTFPENLASQRVLEKSGFVRRGDGVCSAPARDRDRIENAPVYVLEADAGRGAAS